MEEVRNSLNKLVCKIDKKTRTVEIVIKNRKTTIRFKADGTVEIKTA